MAALLGWVSAASAQLQLVPDAAPPMVFGGGARTIALRWRNSGSEITNAEIRARMFQTSSATAVSLGEMPWKNLSVLPGQTVLESARLEFPAVNAETKFFVRWMGGTNSILGKTEVLVFPTNLLGELKPLLDGEPLGLLDLGNELKPALKQCGVELVDFAETAMEDFSGKLAIIRPFQSKAQMRDGLAEQIKALAKKNVAVVCFLPPPEKRERLAPSFYSVAVGTNVVMVAQADLVFNLPENPQAQLNLIYLCKLALKPTAFSLPNLTQQP